MNRDTLGNDSLDEYDMECVDRLYIDVTSPRFWKSVRARIRERREAALRSIARDVAIERDKQRGGDATRA